jgi:hypothetical protein
MFKNGAHTAMDLKPLKTQIQGYNINIFTPSGDQI